LGICLLILISILGMQLVHLGCVLCTLNPCSGLKYVWLGDMDLDQPLFSYLYLVTSNFILLVVYCYRL